MPAVDPLDDVLRLVAEGRLTPDEAAPILAALDERPAPGASPGPGSAAGPGQGPDAGGPADASGPRPGASTTLRLEIREGGRSVVNLRLPLAVGKLALDRIPGLSGEQVERVREAIGSGFRGAILGVDDGDDTVRIIIE